MNEVYILLAIFWIACGVVGFGLIHAHFTREWPHQTQKIFPEALWIIGGFPALIGVIASLAGKYGFRDMFKHGFLLTFEPPKSVGCVRCGNPINMTETAPHYLCDKCNE